MLYHYHYPNTICGSDGALPSKHSSTAYKMHCFLVCYVQGQRNISLPFWMVMDSSSEIEIWRGGIPVPSRFKIPPLRAIAFRIRALIADNWNVPATNGHQRYQVRWDSAGPEIHQADLR